MSTVISPLLPGSRLALMLAGEEASSARCFAGGLWIGRPDKRRARADWSLNPTDFFNDATVGSPHVDILKLSDWRLCATMLGGQDGRQRC